MLLCLLTALGVGGATILGTILGFPCRKLSHRFSDIVLAFAAGVMLSAAILGLILPAISYEEHGGLIVTICGIFAGAGCISLVDRLVPHIHKLIGWEDDLSAHHLRSERLILFIAGGAGCRGQPWLRGSQGRLFDLQRDCPTKRPGRTGDRYPYAGCGYLSQKDLFVRRCHRHY